MASIQPDKAVTIRVTVSDVLGQQATDEVALSLATPAQVTVTADPPTIAPGMLPKPPTMVAQKALTTQ